MNTVINIGIIVTYIFVALAIASILFFAIKALVSDFKSAGISLVGIAALAVLFLVSFAVSKSNDIDIQFFEKNEANYSMSKLIGTGPIMLYFMVAVVLIVIIYVQVSKLFKK